MTSKQHHTSITRLLLLGGLFMVSAVLSAHTKENADAEYTKGNYQQAVKDYEEILKKAPSFEVYYNLGNAYYRQDNITQAILNYERALVLQPNNKDVRFNLQLARSKTIDKITPMSEMFFSTFFRSLLYLTNVDGWATISVFSIILVLLLVLVYMFVPVLLLRKIGFFGAVAGMVVFFFSTLFAYQQKVAFESRKRAVVIAPTVIVKKTPSANSNDEFVIHEGTTLDISDKTMKDWRGIRLADGREGWLHTTQIEEI